MTTSCNRMAGFAAVLALAGVAAPAVGQGLVKTNRISGLLANELVAAAVADCARRGQPVSGVLVDVLGVQQVVLRGDDAGIHTLDTADHKAYTAVTFKMDSIELVERQAKTGRPPPPAMTRLPRLLLAQGGVIVKVGDEIIGAVGISGARGGNMDTECARAGVAAVRDRLK